MNKEKNLDISATGKSELSEQIGETIVDHHELNNFIMELCTNFSKICNGIKERLLIDNKSAFLHRLLNRSLDIGKRLRNALKLLSSRIAAGVQVKIGARGRPNRNAIVLPGKGWYKCKRSAKSVVGIHKRSAGNGKRLYKSI